MLLDLLTLWTAVCSAACVCRVLFGNYIGCISWTLNLPDATVYSPRNLPPSPLRNKHTVRVGWCFFFLPCITPLLHIPLQRKIITWAQRISSLSWNVHTIKGCFSSGVPDPVVISLIYIYASVSPENRWGTHSQVSYLGSSGVLPAHSLHPLAVLVSSSHHITICPPYEVNICFYFYPSLSLTPINVLRLLISLLSRLHPSWKETPHCVFPCSVLVSPHLLWWEALQAVFSKPTSLTTS